VDEYANGNENVLSFIGGYGAVFYRIGNRQRYTALSRAKNLYGLFAVFDGDLVVKYGIWLNSQVGGEVVGLVGLWVFLLSVLAAVSVEMIFSGLTRALPLLWNSVKSA
jgi:hypothetical protein